MAILFGEYSSQFKTKLTLEQQDQRRDLQVLISSLSSVSAAEFRNTFHKILIHKYNMVSREDWETAQLFTRRMEERLRGPKDIYEMHSLAFFLAFLDQVEGRYADIPLFDSALNFVSDLESIHGLFLQGLVKNNPAVAHAYLRAVNSGEINSIIQSATGHAHFKYNKSFNREGDFFEALNQLGYLDSAQTLVYPPYTKEFFGQYNFGKSSYFRFALPYILGQIPSMTGDQVREVLQNLHPKERIVFLEELFRSEQLLKFSAEELREIFRYESSILLDQMNSREKADYQKALESLKLTILFRFRSLDKRLQQLMAPDVRELLWTRVSNWVDSKPWILWKAKFVPQKSIPPRAYKISEAIRHTPAVASLETSKDVPIRDLKPNPVLLLEFKPKQEPAKIVLRIESFDHNRELLAFDDGKVTVQNADGSHSVTYSGAFAITLRGARIGILLSDRQFWLSRGFLHFLRLSDGEVLGQKIWVNDKLRGPKFCHYLLL